MLYGTTKNYVFHHLFIPYLNYTSIHESIKSHENNTYGTSELGKTRMNEMGQVPR